MPRGNLGYLYPPVGFCSPILVKCWFTQKNSFIVNNQPQTHRLSRFLQQRPRRGRRRTSIACPFVARSRANSRSCSVSWDCFILQSIYALGCQLVSSYGFNGLNAFAYGFSFGPANRVAQGSQASFLSRRQAIVITWWDGLKGYTEPSSSTLSLALATS